MGKKRDKKLARNLAKADVLTLFESPPEAAENSSNGTFFDFIERAIPAPFVNRDTSIEAAELIELHSPILRERVFHIIDVDGPVTDEYIALATGLNPSTARPRRLELLRQGRIVQAGYGTTKSGRRAILWAVA